MSGLIFSFLSKSGTFSLHFSAFIKKCFSLFSVPDSRCSSNLKRISGVKFKDFGGDYELLEEIGRGSYSMVYKCKQISSGNIYAVKVNIANI